MDTTKADLPILSELLKQYSFKQILLSMGFAILREADNYVLLKNVNGVKLVVARFDNMDNPVQVYFWPLGHVLSKIGALLYILDNHSPELLAQVTVFENKTVLPIGEFMFSGHFSPVQAQKICVNLENVKKAPNAIGIDIELLSKRSYTNSVFFRDAEGIAQFEGRIGDGPVSFTLYRKGKPKGLQSVTFDNGKCHEIPLNGFFKGYYTNSKPEGASKAILFFSFEHFIESSGYIKYERERVFVFPQGSGHDIFMEVLMLCKDDKLEPVVYPPAVTGLSGTDNYLNFILFYIGLKNKEVRLLDFSHDVLSRGIFYSFDIKNYKVIHFAQCFNEMRERCALHYESLRLGRDDYKWFLPEAQDIRVDGEYLCRLEFYPKWPVIGFVVEYLFKVFKVDPPQKITEG